MVISSSELSARAKEARKVARRCELCPRRCRVDRSAGETGFCGAGPEPTVASILPHFGEEPPLIGAGGAGTIFFSRCNLRCVYCQNFRISQDGFESAIRPENLAREILSLQSRGCATVEPVSPTHHLPGLLEALAFAAEQGLTLPIVYNTNGYETPATLDLLDGIVDVYLPDLKYASDDAAVRFSGAGDYVHVAREAVVKMHAQVGNLVVDMDGTAVRGLVLRHLVLPGEVSGTSDTLHWVAENLPRTVTLSLMAQYSPLHRAMEFPPLGRRLADHEYDSAVDLAWDLGLQNVFVQELSAQDCGIPDFGSEQPFDWGR
ncbi:MAG: radical SAM protein [Thermodesulfobacteriota bacterium]